MAQTIDTAQTSPVSLTDEDVTVAASGSIKVTSGPALHVFGDFDVRIAGTLQAGLNQALMLEGEVGSTAAVETTGIVTADEGAGATLGGALIFANSGTISGSDAGLQTFVSVTFHPFIGVKVDNTGAISGDSAVIFGDGNNILNNYGNIVGKTFGIQSTASRDTTLTVNNSKDGFMTGSQASISALDNLALKNLGSITGQVTAYLITFSGNFPTLGKIDAPVGSVIDNQGVILAGKDGVAIVLGDGHDRVTSTGVIDGKVFLRGGHDTAKIANTDPDIAAHIRGGKGKDKLVAGVTDDTLRGGAGRDLLKAKAGDDTIRGGAGRDKIWTGRDEDLIVHKQGHGRDTIFDFTPGEDVLDLSDHALGFFAAVRSAMTQKSDHLHIELTGSDKIVLKNTHRTDLSADDFVL